MQHSHDIPHLERSNTATTPVAKAPIAGRHRLPKYTAHPASIPVDAERLIDPPTHCEAGDLGYQLSPSPGLRDWLLVYGIGLAFSTYELGRVVMLGAGESSLAVADACFDSAMALLAGTRGLYLSTQDRVMRFENALLDGDTYRGADRLYLPRESHVTGGIDVHDLDIDWSGKVLAVATLYNCIAALDRQGQITPLWRPRFIDAHVAEDRCHLNGFCTLDGRPAYASLIGASNEKDGWREHRVAGGQIIDIRAQNVVASHLSMPHSPRLYRKKLWVLESGSGWFGWVDLERRRFERFVWLPGFLRGLRFVGDYAVIASSAPRNSLFTGLPLQEELAWRGVWPVTGVHIVNMTTGEIEHRLTVSGTVREIYDIAILPGAVAPRLAGPGAEAAMLGGEPTVSAQADVARQ